MVRERAGRPRSQRKLEQLQCYSTGVAVLRLGLKKGVLTTLASTRWRLASTVTSNWSSVPGFV